MYLKVKDYSKERHTLITYYNVGKLLSEAGKHYGEGILKKYSDKLMIDIGIKYSVTTLKYMRQFYLYKKSQPVADQISWSYYIELLPLKDVDKINYYIKICYSQKISRNELRRRIKSKEYERLPEETKNKLINKKEIEIKDLVPDPILIKNRNNVEIISEKILQQLILEDIPSFLEELGSGFTFIKNEYKIKIGNGYHRIDLLLFNIKYNCYVVVELKVTEFKVEYISQVQKYMNYIDKNVKEITNNNTIGIIICKKENRFVIEYCSDERISIREYELV